MFLGTIKDGHQKGFEGRSCSADEFSCFCAFYVAGHLEWHSLGLKASSRAAMAGRQCGTAPQKLALTRPQTNGVYDRRRPAPVPVREAFQGPRLRSRSRRRQATSRQTQVTQQVQVSSSASAFQHAPQVLASRPAADHERRVLPVPPAFDALASPLRPKPADGQCWLQVVSVHSTAYDVAYALSEAFEEDKLCVALHRATFSERLRAIMPHVCPGGPRKPLMAMRAEQQGRPPTPEQKHIMIEAARRRAAATISGSWRSTRSALVAWGEFCGTFGFVHFPVERDNARMFAVFVQHGPTLQKYFQHLRWAHRFLALDNSWWQGDLQQVTLGSCKVPNAVSPARPALRSNHVQQMVKAAEQDGRPEAPSPHVGIYPGLGKSASVLPSSQPIVGSTGGGVPQATMYYRAEFAAHAVGHVLRPGVIMTWNS